MNTIPDGELPVNTPAHKCVSKADLSRIIHHFREDDWQLAQKVSFRMKSLGALVEVIRYKADLLSCFVEQAENAQMKQLIEDVCNLFVIIPPITDELMKDTDDLFGGCVCTNGYFWDKLRDIYGDLPAEEFKKALDRDAGSK